MASRFVTFAKDGEADYTVCGVGFKYLDLSEEEAAAVRAQASAYRVRMTEIERYTQKICLSQYSCYSLWIYSTPLEHSLEWQHTPICTTRTANCPGLKKLSQSMQ